MRSRIGREKMILLVLTLCLVVVITACGGGSAVKSDQAVKDSGIIEAKEDKPSPQSVQSEPPKEKARDGRFIAYDNGTVLDTKTNLMWAAKDNGSNINWWRAKSYCEKYRGGGYTDWRMPTQDELAGLYDGSVKGNNGYHLTTLITLTDCCPWASEVRRDEGARFQFQTGGRLWGSQEGYYDNYRLRALPVRSSK